MAGLTRAVVDETDSIARAPHKARAKTEAEAQKARETAAPPYPRGRVATGGALPVLELVRQATSHRRQQEEEKEEGEE